MLRIVLFLSSGLTVRSLIHWSISLRTIVKQKAERLLFAGWLKAGGGHDTFRENKTSGHKQQFCYHGAQ